MLTFDLETSGLDPCRHLITCAAVFDPNAEIEQVFFFARLDENRRLVPMLDRADEFMLLLDRADRICAFNGARFDLPFLQHQLGASPDRVRQWRLKLHDVFEACKLALDVTFTLKSLLEVNGMPGKTGSGADAIQLAHEGDWTRLGDYCLNDTRVTHFVSNLPMIRLPMVRGICLDSSGSFLQCQHV